MSYSASRLRAAGVLSSSPAYWHTKAPCLISWAANALHPFLRPSRHVMRGCPHANSHLTGHFCNRQPRGMPYLGCFAKVTWACSPCCVLLIWHCGVQEQAGPHSMMQLRTLPPLAGSCSMSAHVAGEVGACGVISPSKHMHLDSLPAKALTGAAHTLCGVTPAKLEERPPLYIWSRAC